VTNWTHKVTAVNEDAATLEWTSRAPGSSGKGTGEHRFADEAEANKHWADPALPVATLDMGFAKFECNKHVAKEEGIETTTWVSREYHPLIVKQVKLGKDSCEVRRLTSFDSALVDQFSLYRVAGRSWTLRNTLTVEGMDPLVTHTRYTVVAVDASKASYKTEMLDHNRKLMAGTQPTRSDIQFKVDELGPAHAADVEVIVSQELCEIDLGEFECTKTEVLGVTSWMSVHWPMLPVKMELKGSTFELVEFDLGHDAMRFYRTAGNSYVLRSTTSFGGMDMESEMRMEVKSIKDGKTKYVIVSMDQNGNELMRNEQTLDVPEKEGAAMPYDDQVEETVTVPAGTFRCIKTEVEGSGMTMWMHHGIVVKSTMSSDNMKMSQELTSLKME
jgi:hypothetical protein